MTMRLPARYFAEDRGNSAAEFAMILPGLAFLFFGVLNLCLVIYGAVSLHSAAQQAARYASVTAAASGSDPGSSAVQTYALHHYFGPGISASFSYSTTGACNTTSGASSGHAVTGTGTYRVNYGAGSVSVPLNATACFP